MFRHFSLSLSCPSHFVHSKAAKKISIEIHGTKEEKREKMKMNSSRLFDVRVPTDHLLMSIVCIEEDPDDTISVQFNDSNDLHVLLVNAAINFNFYWFRVPLVPFVACAR